MFEQFAEFHFLRPWWLLLLAAIPFIVFLHMRFTARSNNWHKVLAPALFDALIESKGSPKGRAILVLPPLALLLAALALAGPTFERLPQPVKTKSNPLVIVLDLTLSMTSTDIQPSRIERAKFKVSDILAQREEGLTAFVAYAGDAYVVTPFTRDNGNILNLLPSLDPDMMPVKGSNAVAAFRLASELLDSLNQDHGTVLLITDGIDDFAGLRDAIDQRHSISILGVGAPNSPEPTGRHRSLDVDLLKDFAMVIGGRYRTISRTDSDINFLIQDHSLFEAETLENETFDTWYDLGFLLIVPLALLLSFSMRRGGLVIVLLAVGLNVDAGWLEDLWIPRDRQGHIAHENGNFNVAADLFDDPQWRGIAKYRSGEFEAASELFAQDESLDAAYNQGNALAWEGRFEEAIQAYDNVLERYPSHEDAKHNRSVLEELLQTMQQQNSGSEENEGGQAQNASQESMSDQSQQDTQAAPSNDSQDSSAAENQSASQQNQNQEPAEQNAQKSELKEEEAQKSESQTRSQKQNDEEALTNEGGQVHAGESNEAREQREIHQRWLRRIPEDPSGLLRRKFQAESNARIERGELTTKDTGSAW